MKNLKEDRRKILTLILIFSVILIFIYKIAQDKNLNSQQDIIFFKLFNSNYSKKDGEKSKQYKMKIDKENTYYKTTLSLLQTVDKTTMVNEKIKPGVKGKFYIILSSNKNLKYEIQILDKNIKPKNFNFNIKQAKGLILLGEIKKIPIEWEWIYESDENQDIQDTKDGENLRKYEFQICTIGS